jgi:hypothetical protein
VNREAASFGFVALESAGEKFESDAAFQPDVLGFIDYPHAPLAQFLHDPVV